MCELQYTYMYMYMYIAHTVTCIYAHSIVHMYVLLQSRKFYSLAVIEY